MSLTVKAQRAMLEDNADEIAIGSFDLVDGTSCTTAETTLEVGELNNGDQRSAGSHRGIFGSDRHFVARSTRAIFGFDTRQVHFSTTSTTQAVRSIASEYTSVVSAALQQRQDLLHFVFVSLLCLTKLGVAHTVGEGASATSTLALHFVQDLGGPHQLLAGQSTPVDVFERTRADITTGQIGEFAQRLSFGQKSTSRATITADYEAEKQPDSDPYDQPMFDAIHLV